jgi:hypothetical protein
MKRMLMTRRASWPFSELGLMSLLLIYKLFQNNKKRSAKPFVSSTKSSEKIRNADAGVFQFFAAL